MIIGIDLGGTSLRIGAVGSDYSVKAIHILDSSVIAKAAIPLEELVNVIKQFIDKNEVKDIEAVSIGVPSSVGADKETVICTTNLQDDNGNVIFSNTNLAAYLRQELQVPAYVNNDTKNILLYDVYDNHLMDEDVVVGIYIGTGVGASVLINGKSFDGANRAALDIGHIPYFKGTAKCSCGKIGCCECYTSGWRLQNIREKYYPQDDIKDLFMKHQNEQPLQEFIYSCAHIFAVMATIFNPNSIVAGGGVLEMNQFPRTEFEKLVNQNTGLDVMNFGFKYIYSKPYAEKGIIGASIFARQHL